MPPPFLKPVFVIVPGAALTPAHYGLIMHLLMSAGYGVLSALLPSTGASSQVTVEDDREFVRSRLLLPILDQQEHDVILVSHSYSSIPASAAATGLSRAERVAKDKKTSIIGQIHLAGLMFPGGTGTSLLDAVGGTLPPFMQVDHEANLIRCPDPKSVNFPDLPDRLGNAAAASTLCPCLTSWSSPIPTPSWSTPEYEGKCVYIKTADDLSVPPEMQDMMLGGTGRDWIIRHIPGSHSAHVSHAEEMLEIFKELADHFESL